MVKPKIAIIVLNYKQPDLTFTTIKSLKKIDHPSFDYQIILVDNGSPDDSFSKFTQKYKDDSIITLLKIESNLGYSGGNNFGINYALKNKFDYLLIVNNDVEVDKSFLNQLFLKLIENPLQIVAPKIYFAPGFEYHHNRYQKNEIGKVIWALGSQIDWDNIYGSNIAIDEVDKGQFDKVNKKPDFISGCCFLVTSAFFKDVGLFDDRYYLYMEDTDLSLRAIKAGFQLTIVPKSIIWHLNSGSSGAASPLHDYFLTRNRLLFSFRYARFRTKFAVFRESIKHLFSGRPWQKRGIIDFYLGRLGKGSWK